MWLGYTTKVSKHIMYFWLLCSMEVHSDENLSYN